MNRTFKEDLKQLSECRYTTTIIHIIVHPIASITHIYIYVLMSYVLQRHFINEYYND